MSLAGKTIFITGASRGIGKAIALRVARDGANVVIAAKTAEPHPKLLGTIYSAAKEVEEAGGQALPCVLDLRDDKSAARAVQEAVQRFGGIDVLVNNAGANAVTSVLDTVMKNYDLMHKINGRAVFLMSQLCIPHLLKGNNPHILNISPPLNMSPHWFNRTLSYTISKYGMSMCTLGMAAEFEKKIAVNSLWPKTGIWTAGLQKITNRDKDESLAKYSRKPDIMADAAHSALTKDTSFTGNFLVDEDFLRSEGVQDFDHYAIDPKNKDNLMPDGYLEGTSPKEFYEFLKKNL
ncbi:hydroxysteroid dehydrogenase-like protein 2 [Cloeon dipterum]|uniref:hydroxysteroid dehydrogenase-like protein 2 n=1 Tax=Cloeon dipterum TaxID=197152 RepID=UPI00321F877C